MERSAPAVARWIRLAREGEAGALDRLLEAHRDLLRLTAAVCLRGGPRRAGQGSALAEATSRVDEVLRSARERFPEFRGATEPEWVDWVRGFLLEAVGPPVPVADEARRSSARFADALAALEPEDREVVVLRHLEGLAWPEIAERTRRSPEGARRLWTRALQRVGELLARGPDRGGGPR
jgi:RNA polymerase sigma-70 factor (ECF subfamily)